ncbi:peptidase inhibitor family I36 protein [Kitasatospora sp. NBC_00458]|uniref:peptidase inhibitor family I36 protein n=1 Tax=Kitasatospora sp. NBC_00458 TaxID=2903568 RepID=UPI002E199A4A
MSVTRRILLTAAVLASAVVIAPPASAQPAAAPAGSAGVALAPGFHAFASTGFSGLDRWFNGAEGACNYVGDSWNDKIRSARTESSNRVELWDNADCTGGAIVIDGSGYNSIGAWVSAYRAYSS